MPKRRVKRHSVHQPQDPSYRLIPLTRGQNAIVDTVDFEWLSQWNWFAHWERKTKSFYAYTDRARVSMHRLILGCTSPQEEGDHKNHDTLDNRRQNLRKCSRAMNAKNNKRRDNKTGYKGVREYRKGRWDARIAVGNNNIHLGRFSSASEAAMAYDKAAKLYHGEFASVNFIDHT